MTIAQPLKIGDPIFNIHALESPQFNKKAPKESVMPQAVLELFAENQKLKPGTFETLRAKSFACIVGGSLPLIVTALFGAAVYGLKQAGILAQIYNKTITTLSELARRAFDAMTSSNLGIASSTGGALATGYVLTRAEVYNAIGSFVGSFFGSFAGTGTVMFFRDLSSNGYQWWYDKYKFADREKAIESNKGTIVNLLADTYNDMGASLKETLNSQKNSPQGLLQLKNEANTLKERLPTIHSVFQKNGVPHNKCLEITLQYQKALETVIDR